MVAPVTAHPIGFRVVVDVSPTENAVPVDFVLNRDQVADLIAYLQKQPVRLKPAGKRRKTRTVADALEAMERFEKGVPFSQPRGDA